MYNEWVKEQEILVTAYFEFTTYGTDAQAKQSIERLQRHLELWNPSIRIKGARLRGLTDQPIKKPAKKSAKKKS